MSHRKIAALVWCLFASCSTPEGDGGGNTKDPARCQAIGKEIGAALEANQSCKVDDDCTRPMTACGLPGGCSQGYVNKAYRTPAFEKLLLEYQVCIPGPCQCEPVNPALPACNAGICGARVRRPVGEPCSADGDCLTGQCLTEKEDPRFVGGYCTIKRCDRVDVSCPQDSECKGAIASDGQGGMQAVCLKMCKNEGADPGCRKSYLCCSGPGPLRIDGWCSPEKSALCTVR